MRRATFELHFCLNRPTAPELQLIIRRLEGKREIERAEFGVLFEDAAELVFGVGAFFTRVKD